MTGMKKDGPEIPSGAPDTNPFGGKNPLGLYVPMSDDEQEVLFRLVSEENIVLFIHGWGVLERPRVQFGDHRVRIDFRLDFTAPDKPMEVRFFDLELRTRVEGFSLFKKRMAITANGRPLLVQAGMFIELSWDVAIDHMDPALVKALKPGAFGLTSRRLDRDTGERTMCGNMRIDPRRELMLKVLEWGSRRVKAADMKKVVDATQASGHEVKATDKGLISSDSD